MSPRELLNNVLAHFGYELTRLKRTIDARRQHRALLPPDRVDVIFDVGANVGQSIEKYRRLYPRSMIYSFEPYGPAFEKLRANHGRDRRVELLNLGVAAAPGARLLHVNEFDQTNSLLPTSPGAEDHVQPGFMRTVDTVEVKLTSIDAFAAERDLERIDILKLDIQGAELEALKGASELLAARRIALICSEVLFDEVYEGQASFFDIHEYMSGHGYRFAGIFDQSMSRQGHLYAADAMWFSPDLAAGTKDLTR